MLSTLVCSCNIVPSCIAVYLDTKDKSLRSLSAHTGSVQCCKLLPPDWASKTDVGLRTCPKKYTSQISMLVCRKWCRKEHGWCQRSWIWPSEVVSEVLLKIGRTRSATPYWREPSCPKQLWSEQVKPSKRPILLKPGV